MNRFEEFSNTYQILEKLGEGSGGIVYLAYHRRLQKEVVLKSEPLFPASGAGFSDDGR